MTVIHEPELTPPPGMYLLYIVHVILTSKAHLICYDFAVGEYVGWAHKVFLKTGQWPLKQWLNLTTAIIPQKCLADAIHSDPKYAAITDPKQAVGCRIYAELGNTVYEGKQCIYVAKTYPASQYNITPDDIRIGTASWAAGSPDSNRANYLAHYAGLPVLLADTQEKKSPMVDWCAEHKISLLPMVFPSGDYCIPGGNIIVDRKDDMLELYHNFSHSRNRASYGRAALTAASLGCQLIYVIASDPNDHVTGLDDVIQWKANLPNGSVASGEALHKQLINYTMLHPNTKFIFTMRGQQCNIIWSILNSK